MSFDYGEIPDEIPKDVSHTWMACLGSELVRLWPTFNLEQKEAIKELAEALQYEWEKDAGEDL